MKLVAAAAALCLGLPCAARADAAKPAAPVPPPPTTRAAGGVPEPKVQRIVVEDERTRIDELRVRGQTRRIVVQPKLPGAPAYQIGTNTDARDPQMDPRSEGRALWQILSF